VEDSLTINVAPCRRFFQRCTICPNFRPIFEADQAFFAPHHFLDQDLDFRESGTWPGTGISQLDGQRSECILRLRERQSVGMSPVFRLTRATFGWVKKEWRLPTKLVPPPNLHGVSVGHVFRGFDGKKIRFLGRREPGGIGTTPDVPASLRLSRHSFG
jgi:hypothetical protein